jgi:hypothetical protein
MLDPHTVTTKLLHVNDLTLGQVPEFFPCRAGYLPDVQSIE